MSTGSPPTVPSRDDRMARRSAHPDVPRSAYPYDLSWPALPPAPPSNATAPPARSALSTASSSTGRPRPGRPPPDHDLPSSPPPRLRTPRRRRREPKPDSCWPAIVRAGHREARHASTGVRSPPRLISPVLRSPALRRAQSRPSSPTQSYRCLFGYPGGPSCSLADRPHTIFNARTDRLPPGCG